MLVKLETYYSFNFRRYSAPWACKMTPFGKFSSLYWIALPLSSPPIT